MAGMTRSNRGNEPKASVSTRVLGVDPGLGATGYAVVEPRLRGAFIVEAGLIRSGGSKVDFGVRLEVIHRGVLEIIDLFKPTAMALEQVHSQVRHPRTSILMAHARGVIVLAGAQRGIPVFGYAAARIKKTLTGSGRAPKEQVQRAIQVELGLDKLPEPHDVADACAAAICHCQSQRNIQLLN